MIVTATAMMNDSSILGLRIKAMIGFLLQHRENGLMIPRLQECLNGWPQVFTGIQACAVVPASPTGQRTVQMVRCGVFAQWSKVVKLQAARRRIIWSDRHVKVQPTSRARKLPVVSNGAEPVRPRVFVMRVAFAHLPNRFCANSFTAQQTNSPTAVRQIVA